jgi:hypothetical protein
VTILAILTLIVLSPVFTSIPINMTNHPSRVNQYQKTHSGSFSRMLCWRLLIRLDHPSCAMVAEPTIVYFNASYVTTFTGHRLQRLIAPPRQDDCINQDKGGRRVDGRSLSKRTRTTQALTKDDICPFRFTVKWDYCGFYITLLKINYGCCKHENHLKGDLSKLSLPRQLIPDKEKKIFDLWRRHALEVLSAGLMFSPNLASSSPRPKLCTLLPNHLSH